MGKVFFHLERRSLNAEDMLLMLRRIRENAGPDRKLALILDNASFHKTPDVRSLASDPEIDIKLIFNVVARPDLACIGIE